MNDLIKEYKDNQTFFWSESQQNQFRKLYYKLFLESFGLSKKCWHNAILKTAKELNL